MLQRAEPRDREILEDFFERLDPAMPETQRLMLSHEPEQTKFCLSQFELAVDFWSFVRIYYTNP